LKNILKSKEIELNAENGSFSKSRKQILKKLKIWKIQNSGNSKLGKFKYVSL
jgi:hypothetical protein